MSEFIQRQTSDFKGMHSRLAPSKIDSGEAVVVSGFVPEIGGTAIRRNGYTATSNYTTASSSYNNALAVYFGVGQADGFLIGFGSDGITRRGDL